MKESNRFWLAFALVAVGVICRVAPHPWNFAPIGAIALFSGASFDRRRSALIVPLVSMLAGDAALQLFTGHGFHVLMPVIYATYALIACLGLALRERRANPLWVGGGSIAGSILFFLISNLGVWAAGGTYPQTMSGLAACFVAAIPFFGNTVTSDLLFNAIFFGIFVFAERRSPAFAVGQRA
jgi:hypothetical protein